VDKNSLKISDWPLSRAKIWKWCICNRCCDWMGG
jgi:hypothetical protein